MRDMNRAELLSELGVPQDYGNDPYLPPYEEAMELERVEHNIVGRIQRLTADTARDWHRMKQAAMNDEVTLLLVSGFRSISDQIELFRKKLAAGQQIEEILQVNAAPGFSEHHTGRAIDIATPGSRPLTDAFETTVAFVWLRNYAARFGFKMPYPRDNAFGFLYEPWHWSQLD